jgi:hypothetical protein
MKGYHSAIIRHLFPQLKIWRFARDVPFRYFAMSGLGDERRRIKTGDSPPLKKNQPVV